MDFIQNKKTKIFLGIVVLVICFFYIGKFLYINWSKADFQNLKFNWLTFLISYIFLVFAVLLSGVVWKMSLNFIGEKISFNQALRIIVLSSLPKYLPGKIWGAVGQVWLTKKEAGIPEEKGGTGVILNTAMDLLSGALLSIVILPIALKKEISVNLYPLFAIIPVLFIILHPPIFIKIINWGIKKIKRREIEFVPSYIQLMRLLIFYIFFWISQCIAVYFLICSFYPISFLPLCGIIPASWVIGFISFVTPGGLGVREGVLSYFFNFYMPTSIGIITSIIIRIWATVGELIIFAIFVKNIKKYL